MLKKQLTIIWIAVMSNLLVNCNGLVWSKPDPVYRDYDYQALGYKLFKPVRKFFLSYDLEEISGLSYYSHGLLAAVEDEKGKLYFINTDNGKIVRKIDFGKDGDYEGIEIVNGRAYVLKSDGNIVSFALDEGDEVDARKMKTALDNQNDPEGLGYDGHQLLIALKGSGDTKANKVKGKGVYSFNLETEELNKKELFNFDKDDLTDFIKSRDHFNKVNDFDPSAIARHPITHDIYVLAADKVLAVFTADYTIKEVIRLDPVTYNQAEGICFAPDGTMYISSEGDGGKGKLMVIDYNKNIP